MDLSVMQKTGSSGSGDKGKGQKGRQGKGDDRPRKPFRYPGVSEEEHAHRAENSLCFCCGSADHKSWDCPKKKQGKGRGPPKEGGSGDK